jgi:hypothetical protein
MRNARLAPMPLQALRESQRQLWRQKCTICGSEAGASASELHLRARVRELEGRLRELEAQLDASRS